MTYSILHLPSEEIAAEGFDFWDEALEALSEIAEESEFPKSEFKIIKN